MNLIQLLPLVTVSITLYVASFHLYMYFKKLGNGTNLSFAWLCLYMSLFALLCLLNYNATELAEHRLWLTLIYITMPLFPAAFIHFAYDFTGQGSSKIPWLVSAVCLLEMILMAALGLSDDQAQRVAIPVEFLDFSYVAIKGSAAVEVMKILVLASVYIIIFPGLYLILRSYRAGNTAARPILIGAFLFLLTGINDTLVEMHLYAFLYLGEYGGLFLILGMAYAMVTQMARQQREMNQARAMTAVGKMATEVVHDLTSPLEAIKLAASIAKSDGGGSEEHDKYLSMIESETRRLADLSYDILQFVNKDRPLTKQSINLNEYMQEVIFLIQGEFDEQQIKLNYSSKYDGEVVIDPDAFKRVILNLAGNARESMVQAATGQPEFTIQASKQGRKLVLRFSDNGPGIAKQRINQIFDPFTSFDKTNGSGLGLPISKQIVTRHGGTLGCESSQGQGATFHITLPL